MSWLARSIADSLRIDGECDDGDDEEEDDAAQQSRSERGENDDDGDDKQEDRAGRGVREDLSEFTETLTRQLWGVATFLAPPPPPPRPPPRTPSLLRIDRSLACRERSEQPDRSGDNYEDDAPGSTEVSGTNEVAGGFADQSSNLAVSRFWNADSTFPQFEQEDPIGDAVGITDEVLAFATNIAHHPETWLDFPLEEEDEIDDFDMSNVQYQHVLAVQHLVSRLAALRIELCPVHMSEGYFWKVYFVLLHPRLNKHDAELLSTPQLDQARALWRQELQKRTKLQPDFFRRAAYVKESSDRWHDSFEHASSDDASGNIPFEAYDFEPSTYSSTTDFEPEKHRVYRTEMQIVDKCVTEEEPVTKSKDKESLVSSSFKLPILDCNEDEDDDWLKEDSDLDGYSPPAIILGNDEDVSFSDLEEDDDCAVPIKSKTGNSGFMPPVKFEN